MSSRRARLALATALALAVTVAGESGAQSVPDPAAPVVSQVALARSSVILTGAATSKVSVSLHIIAPGGQTQGNASGASLDDPSHLSFPFVRLQRTEGAWYLPSLDERSLNRVSGSLSDGIWRAMFSVPATYDGHWRVTAVCTQSADTTVTCADISPGPTTTLAVHGHDYPLLKVTSTPRAGGGFPHIEVTLLSSESRRPLAGRRLILCTNISCQESDPPRGLIITTDCRGRATPDTSRLPYFGENRVWNLASTTAPLESNTHWQDVTVRASVRYRFNVVGMPTSAPLGTSLRFTGSVRPERAGSLVVLQHWASHAWRPVGTTRTTSTGRYLLITKPSRAGHHLYRVVKHSDLCDPFRCLIVGHASEPLHISLTTP